MYHNNVINLIHVYFHYHKTLNCVVILYISVSQTVVRGSQVILGSALAGPLRLNISPKKTEKIKLT
jgi:hypothetical protein